MPAQDLRRDSSSSAAACKVGLEESCKKRATALYNVYVGGCDFCNFFSLFPHFIEKKKCVSGTKTCMATFEK